MSAILVNNSVRTPLVATVVCVTKDTHSTQTQGLVKVRQSTVKITLVATAVCVTRGTRSTQTLVKVSVLTLLVAIPLSV